MSAAERIRTLGLSTLPIPCSAHSERTYRVCTFRGFSGVEISDESSAAAWATVYMMSMVHLSADRSSPD